MRLRTTLITLGLLGVCGAAAACTADATRVEIPLVYDLDHDAARGIAEVDPDRGALAPAEELRSLLEGHLGWHGITLVQTMRAAGTGDEAVQEWIDALVENTDEITAAVGLVYGPTAAAAFNQQWAQHTQLLVDFAVAEANADGTAADEALDRLEAYAADSGSFFDVATGGRLPGAAVAELLRDHIGHMAEQLRAHRSGSTARSVEIATADHAHLLGIGAALASAIGDQFPEQFPGPVSTDDSELRSEVRERAGALVFASLSDLDDLALGVCGEIGLLLGGDPEVTALLDEFRTRVAAQPRDESVGGVGDLIDAVRSVAPDLDGFSAPSR